MQALLLRLTPIFVVAFHWFFLCERWQCICKSKVLSEGLCVFELKSGRQVGVHNIYIVTAILSLPEMKCDPVPL